MGAALSIVSPACTGKRAAQRRAERRISLRPSFAAIYWISTTGTNWGGAVYSAAGVLLKDQSAGPGWSRGKIWKALASKGNPRSRLTIPLELLITCELILEGGRAGLIVGLGGLWLGGSAVQVEEPRMKKPSR